MPLSERDIFHRAARDGYVDLLKDATRKDCNLPDDDGITPTLWAAYYGQLNALRVLVGRGGDPDKCDYFGNAALHFAAANGHINCVSFLVSFGVNLWALDNNYHTAKDVAATNHKVEVIELLNEEIAKQSALNTKMVQKLKEKAISDADKRIKTYQKLQRKASKKAEKEEKQLEKQRKKVCEAYDQKNIPLSQLQSKSQSDLHGMQSQSLKFSDIVNSNHAGTTNKVKVVGAVFRKVQQKKLQNDSVINGSDFKVREKHDDDSTKSVRSLTGLRRDNEILYVPKFDSISLHGNLADKNQQSSPNTTGANRLHMKDVFSADDTLVKYNSNTKEKLYRAVSEPDFLSHFTDSGIGDEVTISPESSLFQRPGFGSVSFRSTFIPGAMLSLSSNDNVKLRVNGDTAAEPTEDSIGSAGSLARRNSFLPQSVPIWEEEDESTEEDLLSVLLFLTAHGLQEHVPLFTKEKIDLEALMLLSEEDLKSIGLPLGPRKKLLNAIELRKDIAYL